jgi:methionyl-tRNA formyltransferase
VFNFIRGLSPYPTAFTEIANKKIKIFTVEKVMSNEKPLTPSKLSSDNKSYLHIACADGYISVLELQPEGKKRMVIADYLRGNKISY